ncbi:MAG: hypothetical protein U1D55_11300 [Phycisphaerae bacterium]
MLKSGDLEWVSHVEDARGNASDLEVRTRFGPGYYAIEPLGRARAKPEQPGVRSLFWQGREWILIDGSLSGDVRDLREQDRPETFAALGTWYRESFFDP